MVMVHHNSSNNDNNQDGGATTTRTTITAAALKRSGDGWPPHNILRVKRPMLGGRRNIGGPSTPVPRWKLYENPFYDGIAAAAAAAAQQQQQQGTQGGGGGRNVAVSARKLAATLWELQEFPFLFAAAGPKSSSSSSCPCVQHTASSPKKTTNHLLALAENAPPSCLSTHPGYLHRQPQHGVMDSLQHPNKEWESVKKSPQSQSSTRQVAAMRSHVHRLLERRAEARFSQHLTSSAQANSGSYMVLKRIRDMQDQQTVGPQSSVMAALRVELERARARVRELELAHKSARREIDSLLKKVTEEKAVWRNKEQEKIRAAVLAVKMEAEEEKKARRRIESVNRKLSRELIEANMAVGKAVQELERERKARELMEDVCDELAREIGEDKAEVEELKRESARVREEVEEERKMLQTAEVWREERVQMKLAEARLEIEEKNEILDHLRDELEAFLHSRKAFLRDAEVDEASCRAAMQEAEALKAAMDSLQLRDVLQNSCRSPDTEEEVSGLSEVEQNHDSSQPDERVHWSWAGAKPAAVYAEPEPMLETRDQVLERLRRKYDQNSHIRASENGGEENNGDPGRKWDDDRGDGSEWNSQSEHQGDDAKDEDGSQWESASDQDILEAMEQQVNSGPPTRGRAAEDQVGAQIDPAVQSAGYESMSSPQTYIIKPPAELSSGDDLWKITPTAGKVLNEDQHRNSRNFLGRGMAELSRTSHTRLGTEQGIASPSRDWRSPDRGNPHIARGIKGFIEWPKMSRETGIKGKVLESKVEKVDRRMLKQTM